MHTVHTLKMVRGFLFSVNVLTRRYVIGDHNFRRAIVPPHRRRCGLASVFIVLIAQNTVLLTNNVTSL